MKVVPMQDWAVIRPSDAEEVTESGLYIPDTAKEKPHEGVVEAIGPGAFEEEKDPKKKKDRKERKFIPTVVKPGDRVLYEKYAERTVTVDGEEVVLVRERDMLGVLPPKPEKKRENPKPLQLPAATVSPKAITSIVKRPTFPLMATPAQSEMKERSMKTKKAAKKSAGKVAAKRSVKKDAKKATKKSVSKTARPAKKASAKRKKR